MNISLKLSSSIVSILFISVCLVNLSKSDQSYVDDQISSTKPFHANQGTLLKIGFAGAFWDYIKTNQHKSINLSSQCEHKLNLYSELIDQDDQEALKILTSSSHLPSKFFESSYSDFEGYSQCLTIQETNYCSASVLPVNQTLYPHWFSLRYNATIHIGFCLPTSCSQDDVDNLISSVMKPIGWEKVYFHGCQRPSTFTQRLAKANASQKWSLAFLVVIIGLVLISSLVHHFGLYFTFNCFWLKYFAIQETHTNLINGHKKGRIFIIDQMRILISFIFLLIHYFGLIPMSKLIYMAESLDTITYYASGWGFQPVNSDWIYSGMIYVGGSAIGLQLWATIKPNTSFSTYVKLLIKRLVLYWPVLMVAVAMKIVLPLFGSGPIYSLHTEWRSNVCSNNFWTLLLHINNYQNVYDMCFCYFWSMAVEFHLFILALGIVYLYKTRPKIGVIVNIITVLIGLVSIFWIFYSNNIVYRLAGYSNEHFSQVETFLIRSYTRTEAHIFTYSFSLLVTFYLIQNPMIVISERAERLITIILTTLVILQSYSPGIWNVWRLEGNRVWYAIHALTCKIICTLGFAWIAFSVRTQAYTVMANILYDDKKLDANDNSIDGPKENGQSKNLNDRTPSTKYKMFYAASRATFFVHYILFLWYFSGKSKIVFDYSFLADSICLIIFAYLAGLIFHYFVIGPFENIVGSFKLKKFGKFE
ncbi:uncharacterized protein LOC107366704 isoform X1 [Tetranychus urticae]|uniref:uncharacterized protein LOC107366704 isoform X1 n=1 Tax=Tetranychus urticae TaxID=32264 RepID=UPI00077BA474|nr:uncharacterized protein LOC107366704 isoform X1 [Tetranychus urticae]